MANIIGSDCLVLVGGKKTLGRIVSVVSDTDGFDGRGYQVGLRGMYDGAAITLPEAAVEIVTPFIAGLFGLLTTENGKATLREIVERR